MFMSRFMPCPECNASVDRTAAEPHVCDPERRADFALERLRPEVEAFDARWASYLSGSRGQFETWLARRQVRRSA